MIQPADVHELVSHWWFAYDNAIYDEWADMFTDDVHFTCRTDTGKTNYEEFVNAYRLGAFGDVNWDDIIKADPQQYFPQITKFVAKSTDHPIHELVKQYTVQEALSWFKTANESVIED